MKRRASRNPRLGAATAGLLTALLLLGVGSGGIAEERDAPLRTEDVVRMLVRGAPTEEILTAIRTRPGLFDVSPDMQEELRLAGVSDELIQAMIERMEELNPSPEPAEAPTDETPVKEPPEPGLRIRLDPPREDGRPSILRLKGGVDLQLRELWQLDAAAEGTPFEDLALFVVCRTATHVPDHWRSKSPLGRDFISMPRHRMLLFLTALEQERDTNENDSLELELPASLDIDLPPGEVHDLSLGVAIQAGGRYLRWTDDSWDELTLDPAGSEIRAEVSSARGGQISGLEVRFNRNPPSTAEN